jgi:hypothetical protein
MKRSLFQSSLYLSRVKRQLDYFHISYSSWFALYPICISYFSPPNANTTGYEVWFCFRIR